MKILEHLLYGIVLSIPLSVLAIGIAFLIG
jgi:hypothetical protein